MNLFFSRIMQSKQIDRSIVLDMWHVTFELQSDTAVHIIFFKKDESTAQRNIIRSLKILVSILRSINQ